MKPMNYIYDVYINLNKDLYDYFDWNKNDKVIHIKKIPVFKVDEYELMKIVSHKIKIDNDFLDRIYNKTEFFNFQSTNYFAAFTSTSDIIVIEFDSKGNSIKKSFLLLEDELEILDTINNLYNVKINYTVICKEKVILKTRKQINEEKFISNELKNIDEVKLNYVYFECFGKKENSRDIMLKRINKISKNSKTYKNLYDILKLTSTTKK